MSVATTLSREDCEALSARVFEFLSASTRAQVNIGSNARSTSEFARGDTHLASAVPSVGASLAVEVNGRRARGQTNQLDDSGLRSLAAETEALARETSFEFRSFPKPQTYPEGPQIAFDSTIAAMPGESQAALVHRAIEAAETAGLVAAGDVHVEARSRSVRTTEGFFGYERSTYGEFSVTARSRDHRGSGWAWSGFEDWDRVDTAAVIARAVDLAERSADPVAIEPGRYTVILEPAAVAALIAPIAGSPTAYWDARAADAGTTVFSKDPLGTNKIGLQMIDRRLGMVSSPWDPDRPASTIGVFWDPIPGPVVWFEGGVLRNLAYSVDYAREKGRQPVINPGGLRLTADGAPQTLEELIASTRRGVWVNRLSHIAVMDHRTILLTGTTRDGTFLIENGEITKPIKNFRFTESPFFVLNQLEAWGEPVRASRFVVAPRLKLRDFNFTSLTDAI